MKEEDVVTNWGLGNEDGMVLGYGFIKANCGRFVSSKTGESSVIVLLLNALDGSSFI